MTEKLRNPRGRPRTFDREVALRTVMDVFWQYGYEGTSISRLLEATGLKATSLYAAFGDKESLLKEAVKSYIECEGAYVWGAVKEDVSTKEAFSNLLKRAIEVLAQRETARGCLLLLGDKGLSPDNIGIREFLAEIRDNLRAQLVTKVAEGVACGELPLETNIEASVTMIIVFLNGISIEITDHKDEETVMTLNQTIDGFMRYWPFLKNV